MHISESRQDVNHETAEQKAETVAFDAMQQFVVAPDRRHRVELANGCLEFSNTGGQFDAQWVARGAIGVLGPKLGKKLESASRKDLLMWGSVIAAVSALIMIVFVIGLMNSPVPLTIRKMMGIGVPAFGLLLGTVMIMSGLLNQAGKGDRHDSSLPVTKIAEAISLPVQSEIARRGEPQVARIQLNLISGKKMVLSIPTESDLAMIKLAIPFLRSA